MVFRRRYSIIERLLGKVPKAYRLTCQNCDYREHLMACASFEDEPYEDGGSGTRTVRHLPKACPKCGGKHLKTSEAPMPLSIKGN